ncbi:ABC transporter permease [Paenibacillus sp. FSL H7-689]|uniref:ABC transporter permease n=1 Tax=Paenibacillus sp. FSL H7-689 TaxID=1227349 RepID=UPI0003E251BF|nr:FtsX-like permease family protein [Paenibacillus sp. FSL H7-689]ETT55852.1 lipoprotein release ABC transporter permease [Paenibacillus sp. FSL H7-689]
MNIIARSIIKSIAERKFRTCLIIFSILIATALFFSSITISNSLTHVYTQKLENAQGNADIIIKSVDNTDPFFSVNKAENLSKSTSYNIGEIQSPAIYITESNNINWFNLHGLEEGELEKLNPITFVDKQNNQLFEGNKIIVSQGVADKFKLSIGDAIVLEVNGKKQSFNIYGISNPMGYFMDESQFYSAIVPKGLLSQIYQTNGLVNYVNIKLADVTDKPAAITELSAMYKDQMVKDPVSPEDIKSQTSVLSTALMVMVVVVTFMSIFIIYTCFKVLTIERLPMVGTFRSIGATKKVIHLLLIAESLFYGVIGAVLGSALGVVILNYITSMTTPGYIEQSPIMSQFSPVHIVASSLFAILLCLGSSLMPILKTSKAPLKEVILNLTELKDLGKRKKFIIGLVFIALIVILAPMVTGQLSVVVIGVSVILAGVALTLVIPFLTELAAVILEKPYALIFGNIGSLALRNIRGNSNMMNTISLIAIGITSIMFVNTASNSVLTATTNLYSESSTFDIKMTAAGADQQLVNNIQKVDGVKDVYANYEAKNVKVIDKNGDILAIDSVDSNRHLDFWKVDVVGDAKEQLKSLDNERNILLAVQVKERLGVKDGDTITLAFPKGNKEYKVQGNFNTLMYTGNYALISEKYMKEDLGTTMYSNMYIKTNQNPSTVAKKMERQFFSDRPQIITVKDWQQENVKSNEQIFSILKGFAFLSMLIGIVGVFNNLVINLIQRRRSLAMLRSIGMSKAQTAKMIFIESLTLGLIGGVFGCLGGYLLIWLLPYIYKALYIPPVYIFYPFSQVWLYFLASACIAIVASISPMIKSSKLNIINVIKYE